MVNSPNIAVVVLDTLRYDFFESYFDWLPGMSFTNAYSTSHWTVPAHGSLFTGIYPSESGIHSQSQSLDCEKQTISEKLQCEGYHTTKYTANLNIHTWDGWDRGFDINIGPNELASHYNVDTVDFDRFMSQSNKSGISLYFDSILECFRSECSTSYSLAEGIRRYMMTEKDGGAKSSLNRLKQSTFTESEFLFINLMDAHVPYYPPKEYRTIDKEVSTENWEPFVEGISNLAEIKIAYEDSVHYLSDMYYKIHKELKKEFDYIITLSDHGEMLGENGMIDHAYGIHPHLSHIPIVISGENIENTTVDTPVSLLDIHATIADLAEVEVNSRGQSLVQKITAKDRLVEYHGILPWLREKFISNGVYESKYDSLNQPLHGYIGKDSIYSFETHENGLVIQDTCHPIKKENRFERLESLVNDLNTRQISEEEIEMDDSVLTRLEDLGYA